MECTVDNRKQVKLDLVTNSAIVDMYGDTGLMYQRANFMAARGLKKLYTEALPKLKHKVWLTVNANTHTATLPLDWDEEYFVGFINSNWHKVPIRINTKIVDTKNITDILCEDKCVKCGQDTGICNDLVVTEDTEIVVINDIPYNRTIVKKLYPNGDYYLETTNPVWNIDEDQIEYIPKKEFIVNFSLLPCGCLDTDERNTANLQSYCPDIYCNYYAQCPSTCCNTDYGGYRIFEESGLIQMDERYPFAKVYIEYYGFISKKNGQYYVPQVSFETLVEWTKWKLIANRKNVPRWERLDQFESYRRERKNMEKVMGKFSLSQIIQSVNSLPKFDIDYGYDYYGCFSSSSVTVPSTAANLAAIAAINSGSNGGSSGTSCSTINNNYITINNTGGLTIAVKVDGNPGSPVAGQSTYQNNLLIGATVPYIIVAKQIYTFADGDFTLNDVTGEISIAPNIFIFGDSLIINYSK